MMREVAGGDIPGLERAAILLMSLGEGDAANILRHMEPKEVQKLGEAMANLNDISQNKASSVIGEFLSSVQNQTSMGIGSQDYIKNTLVTALGEEKAGNIIRRILKGDTIKGLETLKWMDASSVSELIGKEHPQIIATILSQLDGEQSAEIISLLEDDARFDVLMRIASLESIQPSALNELNQVLEKQFNNKKTEKPTDVGGVKTAADILNFMNKKLEGEIIEKIKESDSDMAQQLEDLMFIFDDLEKIDDRGIQTLLRDISSDSLVIALKGAGESMKEKIFKNMSKRAAEMLKDDLEIKGPVKISEVEAAQKEIVAAARRMAEAGELTLGGQAGDDYV